MRAILIIIALLNLFFGGVFIYGGFAHRAATSRYNYDADAAAAFLDALFSPLAMSLYHLSADLRGALLIRDNGLLVPFAGGGALLIVLGMVLLTAAKILGERELARHRAKQGEQMREARRAPSMEDLRVGKAHEDEEKKKKEAAAKAKGGAAAAPSMPEPTGDANLDDMLKQQSGGADVSVPSGDDSGGDDVKIDTSILDDDEPDYTDINVLVSLAHSYLEKPQRHNAVKNLRPDLLPHLKLLSEQAESAVVKQILDATIVRFKRSEKNITPDQFRLQDKNMNRLEREAICMRYMPNHSVPDAYKDRVGKVFTMNEHSRLQQEMMSEADDWQELSLRNAVLVLSAKAPGAS